MKMSNSINFHEDAIEKYECPPSRCQLFIQIFYNSRNKTFLGRTKCSWCKIGFFYFIYYCSLTIFFMSMLLVFLEGIVSNDKPSRTGQHSLLSLEPGLGMRPLPDHTTTLIHFTNEPQSYMSYIMDIKNFLTPYEIMNVKDDKSFAICKNGTKEPDNVDNICRYDLSMLGACNDSTKFGYSIGQPCILIKMNKIYGWIPDTLDSKSPSIKCEGQNLIDKDNIGDIEYFPNDGEKGSGGYFDHTFYPYIGQAGYLPPIVAVQFKTPKKRMLIMVKCRLDNVRFQADQLKFELLVD